MGEQETSSARVPPRWFVRTAWAVHRALYTMSGGRFGLSHPKPGKYGMLRLHTLGRKTGQLRTAILAYYEDGGDLILLAMNGWADPPPAWWLNLQAHPEAKVDMPDGTRRSVRGREAVGVERERLWTGFSDYEDPKIDLDALADLRSRPTPVIVLEPA